MALTLGTDTYCPPADAARYHARSPHGADWARIEDSRQEQLLRLATQVLDQHVEWAGVAAATDQPLGWPRYGLRTRQGGAIDSGVFPDVLRWACAELALALHSDDLRADSDLVDLGIRSAEGVTMNPTRRVLPSRVVELLPREWYVHVTGAGRNPIVRLRRA